MQLLHTMFSTMVGHCVICPGRSLRRDSTLFVIRNPPFITFLYRISQKLGVIGNYPYLSNVKKEKTQIWRKK